MYAVSNVATSLPTLESIFLIIVILVGVEQYLIVVLSHISLMANDAEHLFICSLAVFISFFFFFEKYLVKYFTHYFK